MIPLFQSLNRESLNDGKPTELLMPLCVGRQCKNIISSESFGQPINSLTGIDCNPGMYWDQAIDQAMGKIKLTISAEWQEIPKRRFQE